MKPTLIATLLFCTVAATAQALPKPDFSGTWIFNPQKSKIEYKNVPVASTFIIQHQEPAFHLKRTHVYRDGKQDTRDIDLVTDGKHEVVQNEGPYRRVTRMYWDGDALVLDMKITAADGSTGTNVVRYSLSRDRHTMTALERHEDPDGKVTNRWVFDRQVSAKEKSAAR